MSIRASFPEDARDLVAALPAGTQFARAAAQDLEAPPILVPIEHQRQLAPLWPAGRSNAERPRTCDNDVINGCVVRNTPTRWSAEHEIS